MNIYIDGMFFRLSGIGRIYENVLRALVDSPEVSGIRTLVPREREEDFRRSFPSGKIEARFVDFSHLGASDFLKKGFVIGGFRPAPDLFFFPNIDVPFFLAGKVVSQVNDLIPITTFSDWPRRHKAAFRYLAGRAIRRSVVMVCISEFTKERLISEFRVSPDRLRVIHPWIDNGFLDRSRRGGSGDPLVEGDYLLFVGNRSSHKNLEGLIDAFRIVAPEFPGLKAVVAGRRMRARDAVDEAGSDPALGNRIVAFTDASDEQVRNLYTHARMFVFPTFIEGFGIPPLEALASGVPVVCSDIPVIREVCGDSVRYADPRDPGSFAREIRSVLTDPQSNAAFMEKGAARVSSYGRGKALGRYIELFRSCIEGVKACPSRGSEG